MTLYKKEKHQLSVKSVQKKRFLVFLIIKEASWTLKEFKYINYTIIKFAINKYF